MANSKNDDIRVVMMETAKVQLAALNAGIEFWSGWVESASKMSQAANRELMTLSAGSANVDEVLSRMADTNRKYLEALTELPDKAAARFKEDLKMAGGKSARRRAARAKD
jgi:hypothetical protein